jgi:hypothetical protein
MQQGKSTKKVRAVNTLAKEPKNAASGVSFKPELKISLAAVEWVKHNPKMTGKEEGKLAQGQDCGQEGGFKKNMASTPEAIGIFWILFSQVPTKYIMGPVTCYTGKMRRRLWKNVTTARDGSSQSQKSWFSRSIAIFNAGGYGQNCATSNFPSILFYFFRIFMTVMNSRRIW